MQQAQKYYWIIIVAFSLGFLLKTQLNKQQLKAAPEYFQVPSYISLDTNEEGKPHTQRELRDFRPSFLGKYSFGDSLAWSSNIDAEYENDYLYPYRDSVDLIPADGLQLIPRPDIQFRDPYAKKRDRNYFPVFIPNETENTKLLSGKGICVYAIMEAKDSSGSWRPIHYDSGNFCGMGKWELRIHPKEYGVMLLPSYKGNYATKLRVRMRNGENIIVSKPFDGTISYNQFYLPEKSRIKERALQNPTGFSFWQCFGSYPIEF